MLCFWWGCRGNWKYWSLLGVKGSRLTIPRTSDTWVVVLEMCCVSHEAHLTGFEPNLLWLARAAAQFPWVIYLFLQSETHTKTCQLTLQTVRTSRTTGEWCVGISRPPIVHSHVPTTLWLQRHHIPINDQPLHYKHILTTKKPYTNQPTPH